MAFRLSGRALSWFSLFLFLGLLSGCLSADRRIILSKDQLRDIDQTVLPSLEAIQFHQGSLTPTAKPELSAGLADLSLEKAVFLALHNNRDLKVRQQGPVISGAFEQLEHGRFDAELFAESTYLRERANETSRSSGDRFSVSGNEVVSEVGLRRRLVSGATLETTISQERSISDRAPEQQRARVGLSLTQSLLRGLGPAVNLASVQQAELETLASRYELRAFVEALLADTEKTYWNYILAKEEIAIFETSLALARQQREEVELRIDVGLLPDIEAAAARAEEALRVQALINARSLLEEQRLRLLRLISSEEGADYDQQLTAVSDPRMEPIPPADLHDRLSLAEESRADLHEAQLRLDQQRLETVVTRNGLLPQLDFFVTLGKTGFAESFSRSFDELDGKTYDLGAGLRLEYLLGNRTARARDIAARATRQQMREALANLRQLVHLDVRLAVNELERNRQQIAASRATRMFQQQTLAAEQERFEVGSSTALQVAQAQRDLLQAQINEIEAVVNYRVALVDLYLMEGSLLDRRGIEVETRVTADQFR